MPYIGIDVSVKESALCILDDRGKIVRETKVPNRSEKEWIMPPREWSMAKSQFAVLFGERFTAAMD